MGRGRDGQAEGDTADYGIQGAEDVAMQCMIQDGAGRGCLDGEWVWLRLAAVAGSKAASLTSRGMTWGNAYGLSARY